ncbi:predicted protein [Botrytis cinerea T4]|uniref:Uncharacterized protein n=1 Tax=Botryotinia fuckeliana (strain T4) TaxID=999810 RepID=G2XZ19_BOTF4|nr:predicted protein [Botrytis cinerea T4]
MAYRSDDMRWHILRRSSMGFATLTPYTSDASVYFYVSKDRSDSTIRWHNYLRRVSSRILESKSEKCLVSPLSKGSYKWQLADSERTHLLTPIFIGA